MPSISIHLCGSIQLLVSCRLSAKLLMLGIITSFFLFNCSLGIDSSSSQEWLPRLHSSQL